ncbi:MAG: hypothetical protein L3J24_12245 [Xanthomonadales bacterium]|nr:hypothetical protein [Xanthomonadales bacterium]
MLTNAGDTLTLSTNGTEPVGDDVSIADILASNFDTQINLNVDGTLYSASARDLLQNTTADTWFSGSLASEYLVGGAVKTSGGDEHAHLTAYFHIRASAGLSQVRVDVVLENNWSFAPAPGNLNIGNATINIGGVDVFNESFTHYYHSRWHKQFWWGGDTEVYVKHDHDYLQATKAIPKYEDLTPSEGFLNSVRQSVLPMQNGDQQANMQDPGFQQGIGPLPKWDAVYAISADRRAFHYMLANADAGGSYSVHYRDKNTTYPISIDDYPSATLSDTVASVPPWPQVTGGNPYYEGNWASHQPSMGFLPYIVTGDYYYLEEAQFWTAYNLIWTNAVYRNYAAGWWYTGSLRGQAWAYRSLAQVAYITPDDHAMKNYFNAKLQSNIDRDIQRYVSPGGQYQNNLGAMYMVEGNDQYRFYDYFMSWVVQYIVDLGFEQVIPFRDYKLQFPIGLMGINAGEYCFQVAAQYTWEVGPVGTSVFYNDFNEVYNAMYPQLAGIQCGSQAMADALNVNLNEITGNQSSTSYYFANLQPALAAAADSGLSGGLDAWNRAHLSGIHPDYSDEPIWAVIPRSNSSIVAVNFSADSINIFEGESVTLSWSSANADTCTASGAWSGDKNTNGTEIVSPNGDSIYTLECSGQTGTNSSSLTITVTIISDLIFSNDFEEILQLLDETFTGYSANTDPFDWFDTGANNSMQEDDSLFKVFDIGGNMAFGTSNVNSTNIHSHYIGTGSDDWSNYIYSGRMMIEGDNDNIGVTFYSDYPNSDRYYRLRREGSSGFYISPHGTSCTGDTQTGITPAVGDWYEFVVDVQNTGSSTSIKAKVWLSGTAEPVTWQVDCSDSSATRLLNGTIGIWGVVGGDDSGDKLWDNLEVVPIF